MSSSAISGTVCFPEEAVILDHLNKDALGSPFLIEKGVTAAVAKYFSNKTFSPLSVMQRVMGEIYAVNKKDQLGFSQQDMFIYSLSITKILKEFAPQGTPLTNVTTLT